MPQVAQVPPEQTVPEALHAFPVVQQGCPLPPQA
jgi:hypothetical protein